jgi:hypothetical protein
MAVGTAAGYYAHSREQPLILSLLRHDVMVGVHYRWQICCRRRLRF